MEAQTQQQTKSQGVLSESEIRRAVIKNLIEIALRANLRKEGPESYVDSWVYSLRHIKDHKNIIKSFDALHGQEKGMISAGQIATLAGSIEAGQDRLSDAMKNQEILFSTGTIPKKLDESLESEHALYRMTFPSDFKADKDGLRPVLADRGKHKEFSVLFDEDSVSIKPDCGHNLTGYLCQGVGWRLCLKCALERVGENEAVNRVRQQQEVSGESSLVFQGE